MIKKWEKLNSETQNDYRVFTTRRDSSRSPRTGEAHDFYVLEMPEWINIIALTREAKVVLIHQYRHGTAEVSLEIPGGMAEPGEALEKSAWRELYEETGYRAETVLPIGRVAPNPAIQDNRCHTFVALGLEPGGQALEAGEQVGALGAVDAAVDHGDQDDRQAESLFPGAEQAHQDGPEEGKK